MLNVGVISSVMKSPWNWFNAAAPLSSSLSRRKHKTMSLQDLIINPPNPPKLISRKNFVPVLTLAQGERPLGDRRCCAEKRGKGGKAAQMTCDTLVKDTCARQQRTVLKRSRDAWPSLALALAYWFVFCEEINELRKETGNDMRNSNQRDHRGLIYL